MPGQTPIEFENAEDQVLTFTTTIDGSSLATLYPIFVAQRHMYLEHVSVWFTAADGNNRTGHLCKSASGTSSVTNTDLITANSLDFGTAAFTTQTAKGLSTANELEAGDAVSLELSGSMAVGAKNIVITCTCRTRRM